METEFTQQTISKLIEDYQSKYEALIDAKVRIAISGQSGSGKSSMINAILGKKVAQVGSTETTENIINYSHNGLDFFDLPGCGTLKFPKETYVEKCELDNFDAVIVVTSSRFYENDYYLISEMIKMNRPVYVVRSKMDESVQNEMRDNGLTQSEVFYKIRSDIQNNLKDLHVKGIYLISTVGPIREDFTSLLDDLQNNLHGIKKDRFIADVTPYSRDILDKKKNIAKSIVSNRAYMAALNGINPIPGLDISIDISILMNMSKQVQMIYGLDEESLETLSKKMRNSQFVTVMKTRGAQYTAKFIAKEGVLLLLKRLAVTIGSKEILKFVPFVGQAVSAAIGYKMTDSFGCDLIDESDALAEEILEKSMLFIIK